MAQEWQRDDYVITTDNKRLDLKFIHDFLSNHAYWALGRSFDTVRRSLEHSLNFGIFKGGEQIGFARVVTDYATFGWVADVFVIDSYRGKALGKWLMEVIANHRDLQGFRRWVLATKDAHELYRKFGFTELQYPDRFMEKRDLSQP